MENFRLRVFRAVAHHLNFRIAAEDADRCVKKSRAAGVQHLFQIHAKAQSNH